MHKKALQKDVDRTTIYEMKDMGMSNKDIANKLDCNPATVANYVGRKHNDTLPSIEEVLALKKQGMKTKDIAKKFGVKVTSLYAKISYYNKHNDQEQETEEIEKPKVIKDITNRISETIRTESKVIKYEHQAYTGLYDLEDKTFRFLETTIMTREDLGDMVRSLQNVWLEMRANEE